MSAETPSVQTLLHAHARYQCEGLTKPQLQLADVEAQLNSIFQRNSSCMRKRELGRSLLGKPVHIISVGQGAIRVLCWSQMHGDESTATAALLDIIRFIDANHSEAWLQSLCATITIDMVPMLNPDGAQYATRENHQGIDINRDALVCQSPEAKMLKTLLDTLRPQYAFNLHDQSRYYSAGTSGKPVTLAFMAPPGDIEEALSDHRLAAMQLIGCELFAFQALLKGKVAKYVDPFTDRAFGDYASSQGVATILIESGESLDDPCRQQARKLNFAILLHSFSTIAHLDTSPVDEFLCLYDALPLNQENGLYDTLIRGLEVKFKANHYLVDVGIRYDESTMEYTITDIGDLSSKGAWREFDANGARFDAGNTLSVEHPIDLNEDEYRRLLMQGYCRFAGDLSLLNQLSDWPIVKASGYVEPGDFMRRKQSPSWLIRNEHKVIAALLNGEVVIL